jgi:hypothetical protein
MYDPVERSWTDLSTSDSGTPPTARIFQAFTAADGKLYVMGGARSYRNGKRLRAPPAAIS